MAAAPVGDDQYGEDPSVNRLQERIAELLGKEAALFVPSGTMANQIGLKILTRPGDEVILGDEAHIVWHESGAGAANSGVQFTRRRPRRAVHRRRSARRLQTARSHRLPADHTGRGREHPQSRRRRCVPARGCRRDLRCGARARDGQLSRRRAAVQHRRGLRAEPEPSSRHPSTSSRSRCRKGSAARSAA